MGASASDTGSINISGLQVSIVEGVLAKLKVDVIVNSSNLALFLAHGGMSGNLLEAAGANLQAECSQKYPNGIDFGSIAVTSGHKLSCKAVYHIALPPWDYKVECPLKILQSTVSSCLNDAENSGMESIAFPTLGCGFLNYPHDAVAETVHSCLRQFMANGRVTRLKSVIICVWPKGSDWKHIKEAFVQEASKKISTVAFQGALTRQNLAAKKQDFLSTCMMETHKNACRKILGCGHICQGFKGESVCPPCMQPHCVARNKNQTSQDDCTICYTEHLGAAPIIQLHCGHVYHLHCVKRILENRWVGPRITFNFALCPLCKAQIDNPGLKDLLDPIKALYEEVKRKALMRLQYEGLEGSPEITSQTSPYFNNREQFAMDRYCYYPCYKCKTPYFGGNAQCQGAADESAIKSDEMVCSACCSSPGNVQVCNTHGTDFIEYKCRYCCSIAVFFCFGTTHFCNACHSNPYMQGVNLAKCPAGPLGKQLDGECPLKIQHPANGTEFCLGCGLCANIKTF